MQGKMFEIDQRELANSIDRTVKALERGVRKHIGIKEQKKIYRAAANIFRTEMRQLAPKGTSDHSITYADGTTKTFKPGNLKRGITTFVNRSRDYAAAYVGPRRRVAKQGNKNADAFYGYFVAYGTRKGKPGPNTGTDFIMAAYRNKRSAAERKAVEAIKKQADKINAELR